MISKSSKKTDEWYELIQSRVDPLGRRHERLGFEEAQLTNYAYYRGKQNFDLFGEWQFRDRRSGPRHRVPYQQNVLRTDVARACAMLLRMQIDAEAIPAQDDFRGKEIAFASERFWEHIKDVIGWERVLMISTLSAAIHGVGIIRFDWNRRAGDPKRMYVTNNKSPEYIPDTVLTNAQKREYERLGLFRDFPEGELQARNTSIFSFYHDWASRDASIAGCQWAAEKHLVETSVVAEMFNVDEGDIPVTSDDRGGRFYEEAVAYMSTNRGFGGRSWSEPEEKRGRRTVLIDMWQRPNSKYKKGLRLVNAGGKTLLATDNPNIADKTGLTHLPWLIQQWHPNPGDFWGSGLVEDMRGPQWHLNEVRTAMSSFARVYGAPPIFISKSSGLNPDKISIHPGGVYPANENSWVVKAGPTVQLPPELFNFGTLIENDLSKTASQGADIPGASLPGQMRSGAGMRAISEDRHVGLNIPALSIVHVTRDAARMALIQYQMHCDQPRQMRYLGDDGHYQSMAFTGADLTNDIVIVGTPSVNDTPSTREQSTIDQVQAGLLAPQLNPEDRRLAFKQLRYRTKGETSSRITQAERNEEFEYELMLADPAKYIAGEGPDGNILGGYPVQPWEDHQAAVDCLRSLMYRERFKLASPEAQALVTDHFQKHMAELEAQQVRAMQMAEAMKGMPGQKGEASQPKA